MDVHNLSKSNTEFGLNLHKLLRNQHAGQNPVFSPFSLSAALGMTYLGAKGETAEGIAQVLCWKADEGNEVMHKEFQAYLSFMTQPCDKFELLVANRIFLDKQYPVLAKFKQEMKQSYQAEPAEANFLECAEDERLKINHWVSEQTRNKIQNLIPAGGLSSNTKLVLVNALYFKGRWKHRFMTYNTKRRSFKISRNSTTRVETMSASHRYRLTESRHLRCCALEIPYKGGDISMVIILPDDDFGLQELEDKLSPMELASLLDKMKDAGKVELTLPKFEVSSSFKLNGPLSELGMSQAFDETNADFTGVADKAELYIYQVLHKVFIKVHERGTEAAASTAVDERERCRETPPRNSFHVDHPFFFLIQDNRANGTILFLGRITDPSLS